MAVDVDDYEHAAERIVVEFDGAAFERQRVGGISRMFAKLIETFLAHPELGVTPVPSFGWSRSDHLASTLPNLARTVPCGSLLDHRAVVHQLNKVRRRPGADLVHRTFYTSGSAKTQRMPQVAPLFDMIPELHADVVMGNPHRWKIATFQASDVIVSISHAAANDLRELRPDLTTPVKVCHLGVDRSDVVAALGGQRVAGSVVYLGPRGGYKAFNLLLTALRQVNDLPLTLSCVGGGLFSETETTAIAQLPPGISVRRYDVADQDLVGLLQAASLLVVTSRAEGFGLPVLEGMAAGCPVLASDIDAHCEVAGPGAQYFRSGDADDLRLQLVDAVTYAERTARIAEIGWKRAGAFTWRNCAASTADAYRAALESTRRATPNSWSSQ